VLDRQDSARRPNDVGYRSRVDAAREREVVEEPDGGDHETDDEEGSHVTSFLV